MNRTLLPFAALAALALGAPAQTPVTPGLLDRAAARPEVAPIATPDLTAAAAADGLATAAPASPGDDDLGAQFLLKRVERLRLFRLIAQAGIGWTDNAERFAGGGSEDVFWNVALGAGAQLPLGSGWFLDGSLRQDLIRYDENDFLDFESTEALAGVVKMLPWGEQFVVAGRYVYRRYSDGDWSDETYHRHGLALTLQKTFVFDRKNSLYLAATGDWEMEAEPEILRRHEYSLQAGFDHRLTHSLTASLFYRAAFRDYTEGPLDEFNHIVGAALALRLAEFARLETSASWTYNESDADLLDYEAGSIGAGVNFRMEF
jgi:hypothetical protein